jgi:hypothetical protein
MAIFIAIYTYKISPYLAGRAGYQTCKWVDRDRRVCRHRIIGTIAGSINCRIKWRPEARVAIAPGAAARPWFGIIATDGAAHRKRRYKSIAKRVIICISGRIIVNQRIIKANDLRGKVLEYSAVISIVRRRNGAIKSAATFSGV